MLTDARPPARAWLILAMNTIAFTICFACWMMNGVLVTHLISTGVFDWSRTQMAVLLATPILTGSLLRLPVGLLTDRFGGRIVYFVLMLTAAAFLALNYFASAYWMFIICALGFGLSGASFAVGIAYTSVWFPKRLQGTALGIFGAGNAGAAVTTLVAPTILRSLTGGGTNPEGWRWLPVIYAACLGCMAVAFWLLTTTRVTEGGRTKTLARQLEPLRDIRVWRFGFYYFLVFGGFVALAQWLVPYYVKAYGLTLAMAGMYASIFSLPSGVIRAACGWVSDRIGARASLYWTFALCALFSFLLIFPEMLVRTPGEGIIAGVPCTVEKLEGDNLVVRTVRGRPETYTLKNSAASADAEALRQRFLPLPVLSSQMAWQGVPTEGGGRRPFQPGDKIGAKQLLARGTTTVFFQANVNIFTLFVLLLGLAMGLGKAAVYKHIPSYFPNDVGTVGGLVGVIGGLGGFFCPIIFGILLDWTGIWTTCWIFLLFLSLACLVWMHFVVRNLLKKEAPTLLYRVEHPEQGTASPPDAAAA